MDWADKDAKREYYRVYRAKNAEQLKAYARANYKPLTVEQNKHRAARRRERYANDPEYRARQLNAQKTHEKRALTAARRRARYQSDPLYAAKVTARAQQAHARKMLENNPNWRPHPSEAERKEGHSRRNKVYRRRHKERLAPVKRLRGREQYWKHRDKCLARMKAYRDSSPEQFREYEAMRRAQKLLATPTWANRGAIRDFYSARKTVSLLTGKQHHVDHMVPLVSDLVCGLHCEDNLQLLEGPANQAKSNRFWPDMWVS